MSCRAIAAREGAEPSDGGCEIADEIDFEDYGVGLYTPYVEDIASQNAGGA